MLKQGWMVPGYAEKVAVAVRKWGVPTEELTTLYQEFVLSRIQQALPESTVDQCTSLQDVLGLTAMAVGKAHCQVARTVFALTEAEQLPADSVGRFLFLSDRIQDAQDGAFLNEARRYERTQLAKVFFISEQEVRARIARVAMPMYEEIVDRFIAGESFDLASERKRLGIEDDCLLQVRVELTPVLKKLGASDFQSGLRAALAEHDLRDVKVAGTERSEDSVQLDYYLEAKEGSRDVVERAIARLAGSTDALARFQIALPADGPEVMEIKTASVEVEGWQTIHLAAFEAAATDDNIDTLTAAMDLKEEDRNAVAFGSEARAAIADCVMDGTSLAQTANRLGLPAESAGKLLKSIIADAFAEWCAELPGRSSGPDETPAVTLFVQRVLSAGRLLTAVGAPVRGAFNAKERAVPICRRILAVAEEGALKPEDLEVLRWLATKSSELEQAYAVCAPTVKQKVGAVLENVKEASDFDAYIRKINYPADALATLARREYGLMLEKQLEIDANALTSETESRELAEKATALRLAEADVEVVHEAKFGTVYGEACKEAVSSESDELLSKLNDLRVRLVISEEKAKQLFEAAIALELKPAVDEILEGYKIASGETTDDDKKPVGFQGGVDAAVDTIVNLSKKSFADFTLVSTGLVSLTGAQPVYKYVMSQDMNKAAEFAAVLGITDEMREQANADVGARIMGKRVFDALKNDQPISAELTTGLWEPLGLPQEWADKFIATQKCLFVSNKVESLFIKGLKAHEVVEVRSLAEEFGVKLNELADVPLPKRKRMFYIEAKDAVEKNINVEDLEEAAEAYGLTPAEANAEVDKAIEAKERNDRLMARIS
jgi:hypothetical protein